MSPSVSGGEQPHVLLTPAKLAIGSGISPFGALLWTSALPVLADGDAGRSALRSGSIAFQPVLPLGFAGCRFLSAGTRTGWLSRATVASETCALPAEAAPAPAASASAGCR